MHFPLQAGCYRPIYLLQEEPLFTSYCFGSPSQLRWSKGHALKLIKQSTSNLKLVRDLLVLNNVQFIFDVHSRLRF
jgi:hypothetical protein